MAQNNGLQPTQTSTSSADLNKESAGKKLGQSFTDGQSGLIHGGIQESGGKSTIINNPDVLSTKTSLPVLSVAAAQQDARIGLTGPNVNSNAVGNIGIGIAALTYGSTIEIIESHVFSGTSYSGTGTLTATLNMSPLLSVIGVYSGSTASTVNYPSSSVNPSGAGWSGSGLNILFTNGTYSSFSGAAAHGFIPASGANFYVDYNYLLSTTIPAITAPTTASFTGVNNDLTPNYIPNVGNRFAR